MSSTVAAPNADAAPPDVSLVCPLCGYDLRGLAEPRCPECGYGFTWDELRDPDRRLHPYLFEHHPERNGSSFVQTLLGGLQPRRFWRNLGPQAPANRRRLVIYWLIVMTLALPPLALAMAGSGRFVQATHRTSRFAYTSQFTKPGQEAARAQFEAETAMSLDAYLDRYLPLFPSGRFFDALMDQPFVRVVFTAAFMAALWPWLTVVGTRMMLWISLPRARMRAIHLARCAVHACDVAAWYFLALGAITSYLLLNAMRGGVVAVPSRGSVGARLLIACLGGLLLVLLAACYRLAVAFRLYLRLPNAAAVVALTQVVIVIVLLVVTVVVMSVLR